MTDLVSSRGPSITEILEFVKKTNVVDLKVPLGTILESSVLLEGSLSRAAEGGWVIVSHGWVIVCGSQRAFGGAPVER